MTIRFYTNPMSRGQIARWMLHEVAADHEQQLLAYGAEMQDAAFRAINPMAKVPVIVHDGVVVTETAAICGYLGEAFPEAGLAPLPGERAAWYRWMFFAAGPLEQALTARAMGWSTDDPRKKGMLGYGDYERVVETLAQHLHDSPYVCGTRFTSADVYVGSQVLWGLQFGSLPTRPEFSDYAARLSTRPAYVAAKAIDQALIAEQAAE